MMANHPAVVAALGRRAIDGGVAAGATSGSSAATGEARVAAAFGSARRAGRGAALMPFLVGGFPTADLSLRIAHAYADNGADLVELGIPCRAARLDGPVIRAAAGAALAAGATVQSVLEVARAASARVAVVVMSYASAVRARGARRFADDLCAAGVCGLVVPDLHPHELAELRGACEALGIAFVPLIAPTTPDSAVADLGARARGFVYATSVSGTTGERASLAEDVGALIGRARAHTSAPVALGFGISTPEHAAQAARAGADGVIVGSRLVRAAIEAGDPVTATGELTARFAAALTEGSVAVGALAKRSEKVRPSVVAAP